jgi:hypothetical protein
MVTSFSGGRSRSTRREPLTMGKQLVSFITCGDNKGLKNYEMKVENLIVMGADCISRLQSLSPLQCGHCKICPCAYGG